MERAHQISRLAYVGLVLIVAALVSVAVSGSFVTRSAGLAASSAIDEARLFNDALAQVEAQKSLRHEYRTGPTAALRAMNREAERRQQNDLARLPQSPALTAYRAADERYDDAAKRVYASVDIYDLPLSTAIQDRADELFTTLRTIAAVQSAAAVVRADVALRVLHETENTIVRMTVTASLVSVLCLGIVLLVLQHYKRVVSETMSAEVVRFKRASLTDSLTGLGNHRAYQENLVRAIAQCWDTGSIVTVAMVDVDELKVLNDRTGHVSGDRLLSSLAHVLQAPDVQGAPFRLGGDEFALTFSGVSSATAKVRMEAVRGVIEAQLGGSTVSIGISTTTPNSPDMLLVREQADAALYEAKRRGRNGVVTFDEIRNAHPMFLPARVAEVRRLIAGAPLGVAFQPIWSVEGRSLIGYEALARPGGEDPINPQDAFDIAERIGKAHQLDRVCRTAILGKATELPTNSLLFLNVCPQSLDHDEFAGSSLVRAIETAGLTPDRVVLEITERSIARMDVVVREATRLRALGFRLALDDAGSGNAGLEMLSKLPVDYVKIDRDVIVRAQAGTGGRGVLAGIIAIAHEMRAKIIAEGIEDFAMLEVVRRAMRNSTIDCAVQGYYLGRPQANFLDVVDVAAVIPRLAGPTLGAQRVASRST